MKCTLKSITNNWLDIKQAALTTISKDSNKEPTSEWKRRALLSEHSMIRKLRISSKWEDLKYWVSVHIVRHWLGIIHFVSSQRPDRLTHMKSNRDDAPQSSFVKHEIDANAQAIINISRKRLCNMAMPETREAWQEFLNTFRDKEPELFNVCCPDCEYRGWCYEFNSCGYHKTETFQKRLRERREGINQ